MRLPGQLRISERSKEIPSFPLADQGMFFAGMGNFLPSCIR